MHLQKQSNIAQVTRVMALYDTIFKLCHPQLQKIIINAKVLL